MDLTQESLQNYQSTLHYKKIVSRLNTRYFLSKIKSQSTFHQQNKRSMGSLIYIRSKSLQTHQPTFHHHKKVYELINMHFTNNNKSTDQPTRISQTHEKYVDALFFI